MLKIKMYLLLLQIKDAVALCEYLHWLEGQLAQGNVVTEISGADRLQQFRE